MTRLVPPAAPLPMPEDVAAAVRATWPAHMRETYGDVPGVFTACACQYGLTTHCRLGRHGKCHRAAPMRAVETYVCSRGHEGVAFFAEPFTHPTDTGATGPRRTQLAQVWLADRVCRWICPCPCHRQAAKPEQLTLC